MVSLSDGLQIAKAGADIFSRFRNKRREEKNAKRVAEAVNARAGADAAVTEQALRNADSMALGAVRDAYDNPLEREGKVGADLFQRFSAPVRTTLDYTEPSGRSFSGALQKAFTDKQGTVAREGTQLAKETASSVAPGVADQIAARKFPIAGEAIDAETRKAKLAAALNPAGLQAEADRAYKTPGFAENLASNAAPILNSIGSVLWPKEKQSFGKSTTKAAKPGSFGAFY